MKKILISTLLMLLSIQISFAGACGGKVYYIYENIEGKEFYIPQYSFQNFFRQFPVFQVQDLTNKGTHFTIYTSSVCSYEGFEKLEKGTFFDYSIWDKLRIFGNIGIVLGVLGFFIWRQRKKENKK